MQLLLILILPFVGALLTPLADRAAGRVGCTLAALAGPAVSLVLLLRRAPGMRLSELRRRLPFLRTSTPSCPRCWQAIPFVCVRFC